MDIIQFQKFLDRKLLSETTQRHYLFYFAKLIPKIDKKGEITQKIINEFLSKHPHRLARATLKNYLESIEREKDFRIPKITATTKKKISHTLSPQEINEIGSKLYEINEMYFLIFELSLSCALRRQEVLNIQRKDIEGIGDDKMAITITHAKGNRDRKVFVKRPIAEMLIYWMAKKDLSYDNDYLFPSPKRENQPIDKTGWNKALAKASDGKVHPHMLRHTKSNEWFDKGLNIVRIQQRLGHANIDTTRLYINPDAKKELEKWSNEK